MTDEDWWFGDKHAGHILLLAEGGFQWQVLVTLLTEEGLQPSQLLRKKINTNASDQYILKRVHFVVADSPGRFRAVQMFARGMVLPDGEINDTKTPAVMVKADDKPGDVVERLKDILRRPDKWGPIHAYLRGGRFWR